MRALPTWFWPLLARKHLICPRSPPIDPLYRSIVALRKEFLEGVKERLLRDPANFTGIL